MLRTALRPRFLGLLALVLVLCAAFVWLGRWQLGVAESTAHREAVELARSQAPAELSTLIQPHAPFRGDLSSRPFTATGHYDADGQLLVPGPPARGPARLLGARPVRRRQQRRHPAGRARVRRGCRVGAATAGGHPDDLGWPGPGESPSPDPVPSGQIGSVDLSQLVNTWPGELYNAFGFVEGEDPATASAADHRAHPDR